MKIRFTQWIGALAFLLIGNMALAQSQTPLDIALRHIEDNYKSWNLTQSDIQGMVVSDMYVSKKSGTTHIYFTQSHNGFKLQNGIINVAVLENGTVNSVGKSFTPDLASKITVNAAGTTTDQALQVILNELGITNELPRATEVTAGSKYTYEGGEVSNYKVISELLYKSINDKLQLVWNVQFDPIGTSDKWEYSIDANSSQILEKRDMVLRCAFENSPFHNHDAHCAEYNHAGKTPTVEEALTITTVMTGSYRVFPFGVMAPNDGMHTLVTDPDDATASPFGWHDTNGADGPEFTNTRGNNVHAFLDRDGDQISDSPEPEGGMSLAFDFPYDETLDAIDNADAATVNLFYFTNIIHDFSYAYGFDEAAGNYQVNNYGNGGLGSDGLISRAQADADAGGLNNAFFTPSPDGTPGSVNMFVWDESAAVTGNLNVTAPVSISGEYNTGAADYGPAVSDIPVSGEVVEVNDNIFNPYVTDGCEEFQNASEIAGKIALVDRGGCFFEQKTANAEAAGAIAIIICNFEDDPMGMAGVPDIEDPTIPTISIGAIACATIRQFAGNGLEVDIVLPAAGTGPPFLDGDFDNGIIAHEIGHGISNRLTGGPSSSGCLGNEEQMGEGWSDFFGLISSVKPTDTGDMRRGVGTYVQRQDTDATGIRTFPYSTDMGINPHTYADINTESVPHGVGSVWCAIIWDLYWRMVDEYGFDEDQYHGDGGNNRAIWLVMEGMKLQQCNPGFVSGRQGILDADMALFNGENQCLIWEVFARRGVGFYADEGSTASRSDQVENFDVRPTCVAELKISKSVTPLIEAGDDVDVSLEVINHKDETLTGVTVTDVMPDGTSYVDGSASIPAADVTINGNMIVFSLGEMAYLDETTLTYQLATDAGNFSIQRYYESVEDPASLDAWETIAVDGADVWGISTDNPNEGDASWFIANVETESQQILKAGIDGNYLLVPNDNPVLRFYHDFNTEAGADGGVIEISTDGGLFWSQLGDKMFRGGYSGFIQYATFVIPNFSTFYGDSEGYVSTYVDLTEYAGQEVALRWNFASDDNTAPVDGAWYVDDIEMMDMVNYNAEACVTSDQGDEACDTAESRGTVVNSQLPVGFSDPIDPNVSMSIFPNPTDDQINLSISTLENQNVALSIVTIDGREVIAKNIETSTLTQTFSINVSALPAGFYFVKASTNNGIKVEKVIIN